MNFLLRWRNWIRPVVVAVYIALLLVVLPLLIVEFQVHDTDNTKQAWFIAGLFVIMAVPMSMWGILQHLIHYTQPYLQRHIVRICLMVPVYALNAWFGLRFINAAIYLDTLRECYEAYVIYNFMAFLMAFLNREHDNLESTLGDKPSLGHNIPCCCLPKIKLGRDFILNCKHGVLQYTVVRPFMTIIALICQMNGAYKEGSFTWHSSWLYLMIINNMSQVLAMYCLILFYRATKEELAPIKPIGKFICVKAVVFMSFWQSVGIAILVKLDVITADETKRITEDNIAAGLQDFLICIEMFLAACAHYYCFSHAPYVDYAAGHADCCSSLLTLWDISDVRSDVAEHVRYVGDKVRRRRGPGECSTADSNERTPLINERRASSNTLCPDELQQMVDQVRLDANQTDQSSIFSDSSGHVRPPNDNDSMRNLLEFSGDTENAAQNITTSDHIQTALNDKLSRKSIARDDTHCETINEMEKTNDTLINDLLSTNNECDFESVQNPVNIAPMVHEVMDNAVIGEGDRSGVDSDDTESSRTQNDTSYNVVC